MQVLKCKMCGGSVTVEPGQSIGECEYCGTRQTVVSSASDKIIALVNRANQYRMRFDFDKAEDLYERVIEEEADLAEAHWGIVLCRYGIEYVEDKPTGKRLPTCHKTRLEPVTQDVEYLAALENADESSKEIYREEAEKIDKVQQEIIAVTVAKDPYDIFISFKQTDDNGEKTEIYEKAFELYNALTAQGWRVFFSPVSLEEKTGNYESYIFAALTSAKVMLALGSSPEQYQAVWVKNEWGRYLDFMKKDPQKTLIPCYMNMDAYDLPDEFRRRSLQAQDMSKIGFRQDLIRGLKKLLSREESKQTSRSKNPEITLEYAKTLSKQIVEKDKYISSQIQKLSDENQKSVELCDEILSRLDDLADDISLCKENGISIPTIKCHNIAQIQKKIGDERAEIKGKDDLAERIINCDQQISDAMEQPCSSHSQCESIISLCETQQKNVALFFEKYRKYPSKLLLDTDSITKKYQLFTEMLKVDKKLKKIADAGYPDEKQEDFLRLQTQQENNIETCEKEHWGLPTLNFSSAKQLLAEYFHVVSERGAKKKRKLILAGAGVAAIVLLIVAIVIISQFNAKRPQFPFSPNSARGKDYRDISATLKDAGYTNIKLRADEKAWGKDGEVRSIKMEDVTELEEGARYKKDNQITITYCSLGRQDIATLLEGWESKTPDDLIAILNEAGFTSIVKKIDDTEDPAKENLLSRVIINDTSYESGECFLSPKADFILYSYALRIAVSSAPNDFAGKDYEQVVEALKNDGFTNIRTESVTSGYAKGRSVISVAIDKSTNFIKNQKFLPDAECVVRFSSDDRVYISDTLKNWETTPYSTLVANLKALGCENVTSTSVHTSQKDKNRLPLMIQLDGIRISSQKYYVPKTANIQIDFYWLILTIGKSPEDYVDLKEVLYPDVKAELEEKGFTNIVLKRANDLTTGWITTEGSIKSITVNGNKTFTATDEFSFDALIEIVVHTKLKGCDDITIVE